MIRTIIFDLDGTMYDNYRECDLAGRNGAAGRAAELFGLRPEEFLGSADEAQREITQRLGENNAAIHSRLIRFQTALEKRSLPVFSAARELSSCYWDRFTAAMHRTPGLIGFMERMKKENRRLGVGTDMTAPPQYRKIGMLGADRYLDFIVTSQEAGAEKPDPVFEKFCIRKALCRPEEILFIGDHPVKDVQGALNAGMRALWLHAEDPELPEDLGKMYEDIRITDYEKAGNLRKIEAVLNM